MDRSIVQALNSLVPTLTGPLPPELLELASSLLAQSRNKASSLKADEEIARSFACANLACERLKLTLGLPKIQPRPPCPPRIYQKLYKYLDSALTAGARRSGRPSRQVADASTTTSSPVRPRTPAKPNSSKAFTARSRNHRSQQPVASEIPKWVMPLIRHVCKALGAPAAPPHVFAGVSSILTLPSPDDGKRTSERDPTEAVSISALMVVVYLFACTRLTGVSTTAEEYIRQRTLAIESIQSSGISEAVEEVSDGSDIIARVAYWMREISSSGWTELDWFLNIPEGRGLSLGARAAEGGDVSEDEGGDPLQSKLIVNQFDFDEAEDIDVLRPGLGTMMQDRVDYLSERRQFEYQEWRKGILVRIEEMKKDQAMDLSAG